MNFKDVKDACKGLFCKKSKKDIITDEEMSKRPYTPLEELDLTLPESVDYDKLGLPEIQNNGSDLPTILLMDDFKEQFSLYNLDFSNIKDKHGMDVFKEYNLILSKGKFAGFITHNYLKTLTRLDVAILDMNLETNIKLRGGKYEEYDGVDIALEIREKFPKCKILFCTAHNLNRLDPIVKRFINKFEKSTGTSIDPFYLSKSDSSRCETIYNLIKE